MRLSTRTRYGTRAMVELARVYPDRCISGKEVARRQRFSRKYLEQIMMLLKAAGLARTIRGAQGGYALTRSPKTIKLGDIFRALEGSLALVPCVDAPELCSMVPTCPTREVWRELKDAMEGVLDRLTLHDLASKGLPADKDHPSYCI